MARVDAPNPASEQAAQPAALAITVESFPGLCMGASMLMSLSLHKIGFEPLSPDEGKALTEALLKNAQAWDLSEYIGNPKVAAVIDLAGVGIAILMPRIVADAKRKSASPTQQAAAVAGVPPCPSCGAIPSMADGIATYGHAEHCPTMARIRATAAAA